MSKDLALFVQKMVTVKLDQTLKLLRLECLDFGGILKKEFGTTPTNLFNHSGCNEEFAL